MHGRFGNFAGLSGLANMLVVYGTTDSRVRKEANNRLALEFSRPEFKQSSSTLADWMIFEIPAVIVEISGVKARNLSASLLSGVVISGASPNKKPVDSDPQLSFHPFLTCSVAMGRTRAKPHIRLRFTNPVQTGPPR